jgi:PleD family two-component response regulator
MTEQPQVKGTVLIVDDDDAIRSGLYWALTSEYRVLQASSREEACDLVDEQNIDVVVTGSSLTASR